MRQRAQRVVSFVRRRAAHARGRGHTRSSKVTPKVECTPSSNALQLYTLVLPLYVCSYGVMNPFTYVPFPRLDALPLTSYVTRLVFFASRPPRHCRPLQFTALHLLFPVPRFRLRFCYACSTSVDITPEQPPRAIPIPRESATLGAHTRHARCDQVHTWSSPNV